MIGPAPPNRSLRVTANLGRMTHIYVTLLALWNTPTHTSDALFRTKISNTLPNPPHSVAVPDTGRGYCSILLLNMLHRHDTPFDFMELVSSQILYISTRTHSVCSIWKRQIVLDLVITAFLNDSRYSFSRSYGLVTELIDARIQSNRDSATLNFRKLRHRCQAGRFTKASTEWFMPRNLSIGMSL